jgi:hypothetical protein
VEEGSLTRCISQRRKVLDSEATGQEYIQTVPTKGYRFVAEVLTVPTPSGRAAPAMLRLEPGRPVAVERPHSSAAAGVVPAPIPVTAGAVALRLPAAMPKSGATEPPVLAGAAPPRQRPQALPWIAVQVAIVFAIVSVYWLTRPLPPLKVTGFNKLRMMG